ncbi:transcriptional regulator [Candidatus Roizmanbacteria bacterium RIFCSPHIGHO2_12_FULL_42_10]|uniref:Transcriptional regulator n=1 Tax=Candidatus Roizmanbacteria bacterium RIFCSPHIGHO2_12_FULL_42_10 TaxID=1802053 RepID=A0A1F7I5Z9_9BACT|nr:MAG: transcriptional regulator [Candidatus Roizmanbacteria bacterium RIFCSPHIGHO2_12_FULL_42_10]
MVDIKHKFGEKMRQIRKQKKISQEELAFRAGLHRTYISDVERGFRNISIENIEKLAKALNVNIDKLIS